MGLSGAFFGLQLLIPNDLPTGANQYLEHFYRILQVTNVSKYLLFEKISYDEYNERQEKRIYHISMIGIFDILTGIWSYISP